MKAVGTLIKLAKAEIDALQLQLAEAAAAVRAAEAALAATEAGFAAETRAASGDPLALLGYPGYAARTKAAIGNHQHKCAGERAVEAHLRDQLSAAFVQLKTLERAQSLAQERADRALAAKTTAALDELATQRFAQGR
jgi:flagellar export protein FliJ